MKKGKTEARQTANLQLVKETNQSLLFSLINRNEPVSRAELAQRTGLSPTTVSSLVEELLESNRIMEIGAGTSETSGRKPILLKVNPNGGFTIGIELKGNNCIISLFNLKCAEVGTLIVDKVDYSRIGEILISGIVTLFESRSLCEDELVGISIGVPGLIDFVNKRIIRSTVIPIDEDNDFYDQLSDRFTGIPVFLGNESHFYAYAEKEFGTENSIKNLIFIDIQTGIGAGIILDRRIYTGSFGAAGEIGHISIDVNGPRCKCGNRGCFETMAGIPAIIQKVIFALMSGRKTVISEMTGDDYNLVNLDVIHRAAQSGDALALEVLDETAALIACGINNIINMLNPEAVVLGGEITILGEGFLELLKSKLVDIEFRLNANKVTVRYTSLNCCGATLGGAKYALDNTFDMKAPFSRELIDLYL